MIDRARSCQLNKIMHFEYLKLWPHLSTFFALFLPIISLVDKCLVWPYNKHVIEKILQSLFEDLNLPYFNNDKLLITFEKARHIF